MAIVCTISVEDSDYRREVYQMKLRFLNYEEAKTFCRMNTGYGYTFHLMQITEERTHEHNAFSKSPQKPKRIDQ